MSRRRWQVIVPFVVYVATSLAVHALFVGEISPEILSGELIDTDSYTRILRVQALRDTGEWYETAMDRSNAPFGETSHWTRPLDLLLLGGAVVMAPVVGFEGGLYWAAAFVGPILQILTGLLLAWAVAPLVRGRGLVMMALLAQPAVMVYSLAGRADHHGLILLTFTVVCGYVVRTLVAPGKRRYAFLAGAWGGIGLWVSTEFLLPLAVVLGVSALAWVFHGRTYARANRTLSLGWFCATGAALVLERPLSQLLQPEYDRLSIVHLVVSGIAAAFWQLATFVGYTRTWRAFVLGAGGVLSVAGVWFLYPTFFGGPWAEVDPELARIWLGQVAELQPLWPTEPGGWGRFMVYLGLAAVVLPGTIWLLVRERSEMREAAWLFLATSLCVFFVAAGFRARFATFAELLAVVFVAGLADRVFRPHGSRQRKEAGAARALLVTAVVVGPVVLGGLIWSGSRGLPTRAGAGSPAACSVKDMAEYLTSDRLPGAPPLTIAAHVDFGPELLYRTPHRVLATPYHRNRGIIATHRLLTSADGGVSRILARMRGVDLILLCPAADAGFFDTIAGDGSLYHRLIEGDPPPWLRRLPLPPTLSQGFLLYSVSR
ncbi:MAG: hypothetical protein P8170_14525 [Gemmatimonadota bacterium]